MIFYKTFIIITISLFFGAQGAQSKGGYIKRGLKHCTGVCDQESICTLDQDKKYRWCLKKCSHKIDVKKMCKSITPPKMRPFLPYEDSSATLSTNEVSPLALLGLDMKFIKQTTDRKRLVGTAKKLLLVHEQYVRGKNIQKLSSKRREKRAKKLFREFFKNSPETLKIFDKTKQIPDEKMVVLFNTIKRELTTKYNKKR